MRGLHFFVLIGCIAMPPALSAEEPASGAALRRFEAKVPAQGWYPAGYYDVRIAAEAELAENPGPDDGLVADYDDGQGKRYDILGCGGYAIVPGDVDAATMRYGDVALEISRMRSELERIGYPAAVYADPLNAYERALVDEATARSEAEVRLAVGLDPGDGMEEAIENEPPAWDEAPEIAEPPEMLLGAAIETNRKRLAPKLPMVVADGGCGDAPPAPVIIRTTPPGARVLLISAFAFKVCTRKLPDPWDRFACRWNEIETGKPSDIRGRNAYQIRWPDGTERRGVRAFELNYNDDTPTTATFRKTGS